MIMNEHCMFKPNQKPNDTSKSVLCGQLNGILQSVKQMFGALGVAESDSIKQCLNTVKPLKMISGEGRECGRRVFVLMEHPEKKSVLFSPCVPVCVYTGKVIIQSQQDVGSHLFLNMQACTCL